jgi:hypothetical protein
VASYSSNINKAKIIYNYSAARAQRQREVREKYIVRRGARSLSSNNHQSSINNQKSKDVCH